MITMKKLNEEVVNPHSTAIESKKLEVEGLSISLSLKSNYSSSTNTTTTKSSESNLQSILSPSTSTCHTTCTCYQCQRRNNVISNQSITSLKKSPSQPVRRKTPNLKLYEKYIPRPTYAQQDSIYRFETTPLPHCNSNSNQTKTQESKQDLTQLIKQKESWKEEALGDDIYTSLVTLKIFEEKGHHSNEGLSDLLEQRTKELKQVSLRTNNSEIVTVKEKKFLPPRQPDCITLSYRKGPKHVPLTFFHTMKLKNEEKKLSAYRTAYQHCILANSGLTTWLKRPRKDLVREEPMKCAPISRKSTLKRSLFMPRRQKSVNEAEGIRKRSVDMISSPIHLIDHSHIYTARVSFDSTIEIVKLPDVKDTQTIQLSSPGSGKITSYRKGRILSSLSRRTSKRLGKQEIGKNEEAVLNELCKLLPQFEKSSIIPYVQEANYDFKMALQLCKTAIVSGKLL